MFSIEGEVLENTAVGVSPLAHQLLSVDVGSAPPPAQTPLAQCSPSVSPGLVLDFETE